MLLEAAHLQPQLPLGLLYLQTGGGSWALKPGVAERWPTVAWKSSDLAYMSFLPCVVRNNDLLNGSAALGW